MASSGAVESGRLDRLKRGLPGRVAIHYLDAGGGNWAAAIALNLLVSLFPMVLLILFVVSLVLRDQGTTAHVLEQFARVLPGGVQGDAYKELSSTLEAVRSGTGLLGIVSVAGLLWTGSRVFGCAEQALGRVQGDRPRPFIPGKLVHFAMTVALFVLTLVGVGGSSVLALLGPVVDRHGAGNPFTGASGYLLNAVAGTITGVLLFGLIYGVLPRGHRRLREILPGTLLAGVAFEGLTLLFPLYITIINGSNRYGATFGLLLVLIAYCFLLAQILMIGACLNAVLAGARNWDTAPAGYTPQFHA